jgi:hypothetical protein
MRRSDLRLKYLMFTLAGIFGLIKLARWIYVIQLKDPYGWLNESRTVFIYLLVSSLISISFDIYIYMLFFILYTFFLNQKRQKY